MFKSILRKIYVHLDLPQKQACVKYYKYFKRWYFVKNVFVFFIEPFLIKEKIKNINLFEQRFYSQNGEDGIIKVLFSKIGTTNKFCVEFGIEPIEGNTIYLKKKNWNCLWMDGKGDGEIIKKEFINAGNINSLFKKYKVPKEFDLLSIDIDSNDYWVWKAIDAYSPRVVIMEYNSTIPPTESKTIKYDPHALWDHTNYFGASLLALQKLGASKGYTLIACDNMGINAFFVRNDLLNDHFEIKKNITEIYRPPKYGRKVNGKYVGHAPSNKSMVSV